MLFKLTAEKIMSNSLDDLIALLLQKQHPFSEETFLQAMTMYRQESPIKGSMLRQQVNLAACLYLDVTGERPSQPRVVQIGGWGSRNDVLADIANFHRGRRPTTQTSSIAALPSVLPGVGMKAGDALLIATQQGLEAARKMIEDSVRAEFETRLAAASEDFSQRLAAYEEVVNEAGNRKDLAEAQRLLMERKLDEANQMITTISAGTARTQAELEANKVQNRALTENLVRDRAALDATNMLIVDLKEKLEKASTSDEAERRQALLHLDASRQKDVVIDKIRALLEKEKEGAAGLQVKIVQLTSSNAALASDNKRLESALAAAASHEATLESLREAIVKASAEQYAVIAKVTSDLLAGMDKAVAKIDAGNVRKFEELSASLSASLTGGLQDVLAGVEKIVKNDKEK
jgi:hypothetical protein